MARRRTARFSRLKAHPLFVRTRARGAVLGRFLAPVLDRLRHWGLVESVTKFILTVGDEGAVLVQLRGSDLTDAVFIGPESEDGLGVLTGYLRSDTRAEIVVVADVLEQMYREEQMPKVGRFDRANVLKRRLEMAFPHDRLRAALPLPGGRMIFASLPETEAIRQWVEFLESLPNPVTGFCLMPLESAGIAAELGPSVEGETRQVWRVLVSQQATSGFRQIFETEGRMVVTRLSQTPSAELTPEAAAQLIERELRSSISYVKRLGYSDQDRLDLIVLGTQEICRAVEERDLPVASLAAYTPYQAGLLLGLGEVAPEDSGLADVLHAQWLAMKRRALLTLPTAALRERLVYDRIFRFGFATSAALSLIAIAELVSLGLDAFDTRTTTDVLETQLATERQATEIIRGKLTSFDVPVEDVQLVDQTVESIAKSSVDANALLDRLAATLGTGMAMQKVAFRFPSLIEQEGAPGGATPPPRLSPRGRGPAAKDALYELSFAVRFEPNSAQPNLPLQQAKELGDRLRASFPEFELEILHLPVNALRSQVIEGSGAQAAAAAAMGPPIADYLLRKKA